MCSVVVDADNALGCRTFTSIFTIRHIVSEKFGVGMIGGVDTSYDEKSPVSYLLPGKERDFLFGHSDGLAFQRQRVGRMDNCFRRFCIGRDRWNEAHTRERRCIPVCSTDVRSVACDSGIKWMG